MATSESCCTLDINCGGSSNAQFSELRRKSLRSLELARAVSSIGLDEGRQEALKRGGYTKNLAATRKATFIDFVKYLVENRISADSVSVFFLFYPKIVHNPLDHICLFWVNSYLTFILH